MDEVHAGDSYLSHSDWRLHFGLGQAQVVSEATIQWPSGTVTKLVKLPVNRSLTIVEGKGIVGEAAQSKAQKKQ